jgi:hypothetical protein
MRYHAYTLKHVKWLFVILVAASATTLDASVQSAGVSILQRFLAKDDGPPVEYRALRHLEAHNVHFRANAWMDAWTEYDHGNGFQFQIVAEGGSGYIRKHVLRAALEAEQKMWAARAPQRAAFTTDNYEFRDRGAVEGLASLGVKPRRRDVLLIEGAIFVEPDDGELRRIEGQLSKAPSMWTRRVDIVRRYERLGGVRVPVSIESVAHVLIAGHSTFRMTYEYESVNGQEIGRPQPRAGSL